MPTSYSVILVLLVSALILVCRFADSSYIQAVSAAMTAFRAGRLSV